jgi:LPS-assembly protein
MQAPMIVFAVQQTAMLATHFLMSRVCAARNRFIRHARKLRTPLPLLVTQLLPCYGCELRDYFATIPISLSNTIRAACHGKTQRIVNIFAITFFCAASLASPQFGRAQTTPPSTSQSPPPTPTNEQENEQSVERPDFSVHVERPGAPKNKLNIPWSAECLSTKQEECVQEVESENGIKHLKGVNGGQVVFEFPEATLKADTVDFDTNSNDATATGHVYYRDYAHDEVMYADKATYNTDTEMGKFTNVHGYMKAKIVARPGILTSKDPFYFEAQVVDKTPEKYILHEAFMTDCEMPHPWWTMYASLIDYYPHDRAVARNATYHFRGIPVFFFPYFTKSLKTEPRKSGFLTPNIGHSSTRGFLIGLGYYQTLGRSMDATYVLQDFSARGYAHHVDFRGKPTQKSDFDLIFYGVQDRGIMQNGVLLKAPGFSLTGTGKIEFGNGWIARGSLDYLSSYLFHQQFTDSFTQAIFSETHSAAYLEKHFGDYTFDVSASRTQNFLDTTKGNDVLVRTLPEFSLTNNYQQIAGGPVPLWFSLQASYGLFHRAEPKPEGEPVVDYYETSQFSSRADFEPSLASAIHIGDFTILPEVTQHELFYSQSLVDYVVSGKTLLRSAPEGKADLIFPSISRIFNKKTVFGDKLKHVIEPRVSYDYVTGVHNFNNTLLFDPTDLLTDTREAGFSIANRIYAKRGDTVSEIFSWNLSGKYYFDPTFGGALVPGQRNVMLTELNLTGYSFLDGYRRFSPIDSTFRASPITGLSFIWQADYDPTTRRIVNSSVAANIRVHRYFVTAGSDQIHPDPILAPAANQFRATFGYGDTNRKGWNAAFSMVYDYRLSLLEYGIAQVTYNTSCCGFSIQVRRLDFGTVVENQYLASFSIANVASVGTLKKQERIF